MTALFVALGMFAMGWVLHVALWRIRLPRRHSAALLMIFGLLPVLAIAVWVVSGASPIISWFEVPGIMALYAGAVFCYVIVYSGVEQTSPTVAIVRALAIAGESGCSPEELAPLITEDSLIRPRLDALRLDGMITPAGEGCSLTGRGRSAARMSMMFSPLFNLGDGA
jgi:hypothetical protein